MKITQTLNYTFSLITEPDVKEAIAKLPQWVDEIKEGRVYWKAHDDQQMAAFLHDLIRIGINI